MIVSYSTVDMEIVGQLSYCKCEGVFMYGAYLILSSSFRVVFVLSYVLLCMYKTFITY